MFDSWYLFFFWVSTDRVQISCDRMAQTAGGYEEADCLHFDLIFITAAELIFMSDVFPE